MDKKTILHFISLIRERPAIWDTQSLEHKMKNKRNEAVEEVAELMGISMKEVISKWTILKNQFSREKRKIMGSGADSGYTTKWFAYKEMEDIMSTNTPYVTIYNNIEEYDLENSMSSSQKTPPKKKKKEPESLVYQEAVGSLKAMREIENPSQSSADELTHFGLYIAARLGKYSPHLQCQAKFAINKILYRLDLESLGSCSPPDTSVSNIDDSDGPYTHWKSE